MGRFGSRIALWVIFSGLAAHATAQQSIQFVEPVQLSLKNAATSFDAYGRRFSLTLVDNERVLRKLPAQRREQLDSYRLMRGTVDGAPGSWVRLTETPRGIEGAIWDGEELYAVTRYEHVAPYLTTPLQAVPGQTVMYRLSDARGSLPRDFCSLSGDALEGPEPTGLDQYKELVSELQAGTITPSITRQIEISLIADSAFQAEEPEDPTAAMLTRLNIVEGIFSEQVGLLVLATDVRLMPASSDPFTSTKGATLLDQLGAYRKATPAVRSRGIAHLMTGKDLDGTIAGIAYVRTVCDAERGVSLSERHYGTLVSSLIMAHELGHNFGAEHDGENGKICANAGDGFIMAPTVSGNATFSHCSIESMQAALASASCVTPAEFADLALEAQVNSVSGEGGLPFTVPLLVRSLGNLDAQNAVVTISLPANAAYSIDAASSTRGSCSIAAQTVTCTLGDLASTETAGISVIGRSSLAGSFNVQARLTASNDRLSSNNNRQLPVTLRSGIDAALSVSASATEVMAGSAIEIHADVTSRRALPVRGATLSLNMNQPLASASLPGGVCTVNASAVSCVIDEIAPGATRRLTVQAATTTPGSLYASANVGAPGDGDIHNNSDSASVWIQAARDVELSTPTAVVELAVGAVYEVPFTLRSRGSQATGDVALLISIPSPALAVDSLDAGGATCAQPGPSLWRCELGALAPGALRVVRLRVHASGPFNGDVMASLVTDDDYAANNNANVQLRVDHLVDLAVTMAAGGTGLEGEVFGGEVTLRSYGRQATSGATLDIELHSAGLLRSARLHHGADCALLSDTLARCTLPTMARYSQLYIDYTAEFAEPGSYDVRFTANAPGDTALANDTLARAVLVRPYLDAGVSGSLDLQGIYVGQSRERTFTVSSGRRGLASVRFVAAHAPPSLIVEAISADLGDCRVVEDLGGVCDFIDLPADSSTAVRVTYRAADTAAVVEPLVYVSTDGDVAVANNSVSGVVETFGLTDVELRVNPSLDGPRSTTLTFPTIQVVNGGNRAMQPRLEIELPVQFEVIGVSASNALCSGTVTVRCDFDTLDPMSVSTVSLTVRANAQGSFISKVRVSSANDTNPDNDSRDVALQITNTPTAASNGSGKGGGGRIEWLMLLALAALKWGHSPFASKRGRS